MGFLRVPRSLQTEVSPFLSPPCKLFLENMNTQQVQSTPERPLTSNATLGFQFSFCLALVESPCRKSYGKEERDTARTVTFPTLMASPLLLLPHEAGPTTGLFQGRTISFEGAILVAAHICLLNHQEAASFHQAVSDGKNYSLFVCTQRA